MGEEFIPIKEVPILQDGVKVGRYLAPTDNFLNAVAKNMDSATRYDGSTVRVNRKLAQLGHYSGRAGFDIPAEVKLAVPAVATPLQVPVRETKEKSK